MNGNKTRLLKKQAVEISIKSGKPVSEVYNGLKKMIKDGIITFDK